jgi:proline iminopeptidase
MDMRAALHPPIEPFDSGMLPLDDIHTMYWETSGKPDGVPVLFLHGGPVLFDQRGAGASTPVGETSGNTTQQLVADIERLREYLGIERWLVFGGSWGSTLGLAYGQAHPQRCLGFLLRGIFLGRASEIEWFLYGLRNVFPEAWHKFAGMLPEKERTDLLRGYLKRLFDPDPRVHLAYARAWSEYEGSCSTLLPNPELVRHFTDEALALARLEAHYFAHGCFLGPHELLGGLDRIRHLPASIVQSRYDMVCPIVNADELARAWPSARYVVVPDAGHSVWETPVQVAVMAELERLKRRLMEP